MNLSEDGSFSGDRYTGAYPRAKQGETYADYRARVDECKKQGFHLGDLSWSDWTYYCMGSGQYEGVDSNSKISI